MKESGYYPAGAEFDKNAPYNEPLDVEYKRYVSISVSFILSEDYSPDTSEDIINSLLEEKVKGIINNSPLSKLKEFSIDEITIIED